MTALELKDSKNFRTVYLKPTLNEKLIEMTEPDAVNSPTQKYRLTEKGKALLKDVE